MNPSLVLPDLSQGRQDVFRKKRDVLLDEGARHGAVLNHQDEIADPKVPHQIKQLVTHGLGPADNAALGIDQLIVSRRSHLRHQTEIAGVLGDKLYAPDIDLAWKTKAGEGNTAKPTSERRLDMRAIFTMGALIRFADRDTLAEGETIGIAVATALLGHIPVTIEDSLTCQFRPEPAEV